MTPEQRQAVIDEARSWLRTPYRSNARLKGVGADCAMFPLDVYATVLDLPPATIPRYQAEWHLHHSQEVYLDTVRALGAREVAQPSPGDFVLWRVGRVYSHGAIVLGWPDIIHAVNPSGVLLASAATDALLMRARSPLFFTL